ncbi:MAG: J domain-containing protein [Streptosporangiaceae bacterium]
MRSGVTWYGILGVMPGASQEEIRQRYDAKSAVLRPEHVAGAPSSVVAAVARAQALLDQAFRVLSDRDDRLRYDESAGLRRSGGGLARRSGSLATEAGWWPPDLDDVAGFEDATEAFGVLTEMTDIFTPNPPRRPGRVVVPDVRWLFYSVCREAIRGHELQLNVIRLTEHPMPVDGLVVDQSPRPFTKARRAGGLTIQVWHPRARPAGR